MDTRHIKKKMSDALMRSGYLQESRIVQNLTKKGFFVEPNQKIADAKTGKTREIDLVAELWDPDRSYDFFEGHKLSVLIRFICEAKNNPNPVVLMTILPLSPNIAIWESLREGRTGIFAQDSLESSFQDFLVTDQDIYTQYCSFKTKGSGDKSEWMACHPDDFHDDLEKIIAYCDQESGLINGLSNNYHRLHLYLPIVILGGDLYVAKPGTKSVTLKKVDIARYVHFGIKDDHQTLAFVVFVTESQLDKFFQKTIEVGRKIEEETAGKFAPR